MGWSFMSSLSVSQWCFSDRWESGECGDSSEYSYSCSSVGRHSGTHNTEKFGLINNINTNMDEKMNLDVEWFKMKVHTVATD